MNSFDKKREINLENLKKNYAYRSRIITESPQQVTQVLNGEKKLNFASNDYLGLANHTKLKEAFKQGIDNWGVGSGAAHLINGHSKAHHQLEEQLAEFTNRPRALLFSSGYMANLAVLNTLYGKDTTVFQDKLNHASLIDAGLSSKATLKRYRHKDTTHLQKLLESNQAKNKAIITDGVFSMDGDIAPLQSLVSISENNNVELMVDDAHGFGVLGKTGAGTCESLSLTYQQVPILMATLGKAIGCFGAFVAGSETLIETLINNARNYIYTTAPPPALAIACLTSIQLIKKESWRRIKLQENIIIFKEICKKYGIKAEDSDTAIQPIIIADKEKLLMIKQTLFEKGFIVGAIRPPTVPKNTQRLRVTLSSNHSKENIRQLLEQLNQLELS